MSDLHVRVLLFLGRQAARLEPLAIHVEMSADELRPELDAMERRGWIRSGVPMWVGDAISATDVFALTDEGREELRREHPDAATEPVTLTRDELLEELERELLIPRWQLVLNPVLRGGARFHYWPSNHGWSSIRDNV